MRLATMTIDSGQTISNVIDVAEIDQLSVFGPSALTGVIDLQISPDKGSTWYPTGEVPAIDILVSLDPVNGNRLRLESTLAEAADREFPVHGGSLITV